MSAVGIDIRWLCIRVRDTKLNVTRMDYTLADLVRAHVHGDVSVEDDRYIFLRGTGLTDKNNREIFEGDIIRWENYGGTVNCKQCGHVEHKHATMMIVWMRDQASWGHATGSAGEAFPFHFGFKGEKIEIIGNIYDTPELLK